MTASTTGDMPTTKTTGTALHHYAGLNYLNSREFQGLAANALVSVGVGLVLGGFCAATAGIGCLLAVGAAAGYSGYLAQAVVTQHYDPREAVQATIGGAAGAGIGLALAPVLSGVKSLASSAITKVLGQTSKTATKGVQSTTVQTNKVAGDAFRDHVASRLGSEHGFNVIGTEVSVKTPLGRRVIDVLAERNGGLVNFETKLGGSRYLPSQRAKDWWISNVGVDVYGNGSRVTFPTVVIRGPLS